MVYKTLKNFTAYFQAFRHHPGSCLLIFQSYDNCFITNTAFSLSFSLHQLTCGLRFVPEQFIIVVIIGFISCMTFFFFIYSLCKWPHTLTAVSLFRYWIWMHSWVRACCNASWLSQRPKFQFHSSEHAEYLTEHGWFNEYSCSNLAPSAQLK